MVLLQSSTALQQMRKLNKVNSPTVKKNIAKIHEAMSSKKNIPKELLQNNKIQVYHHKIMVRIELKVKAVIKSGTVKYVMNPPVFYENDPITFFFYFYSFFFLFFFPPFLKTDIKMSRYIYCVETCQSRKPKSVYLVIVTHRAAKISTFSALLVWLWAKKQKLGLFKAIALQILAQLTSFVVTDIWQQEKKNFWNAVII